MSTKQEQLLELIKKKKECDKKAHDVVLHLIDEGVQTTYLIENALFINEKHFDDVIEERRISGICGWALCDNKLNPSIENKKQKYIIRGKRVLDITNRKSFCSSNCYAKATHFKKQLLVSPLWLRDEEFDENIKFEILGDDTELHGTPVNITGLQIDDDKDDHDDDNKKEKDSKIECSLVTKNVARVVKELLHPEEDPAADTSSDSSNECDTDNVSSDDDSFEAAMTTAPSEDLH